MTYKVLVIDDDVLISQAFKVMLERMDFQADFALDGFEGLEKLYSFQPDLILLDVMLPRMDGWQICARIREFSTVPIIMVTALNHRENIVKGLNLGADDYLTKPVSHQQLQTRIQILMRRIKVTQKSQPVRQKKDSIFIDDRIVIDLRKREVTVADRRVKLSPTEFRLLVTMAQHEGKVLPHEYLLSSVWGGENSKTTDYLHVYIGQLRQKLEKDPSNPRLISNEWGVGYRLG